MRESSLRASQDRFYGTAQAHVLAPLGGVANELGYWGAFGERKSAEELTDYVRRVNAAGGVVSVDIGVYRDGKFDKSQIDLLKYVGEHV